MSHLRSVVSTRRTVLAAPEVRPLQATVLCLSTHMLAGGDKKGDKSKDKDKDKGKEKGKDKGKKKK